MLQTHLREAVEEVIIDDGVRTLELLHDVEALVQLGESQLFSKVSSNSRLSLRKRAICTTVLSLPLYDI